MRYTLLINTCDRFEDCWDPFFKLFSIYWPDYSGKIYLNTEYKEYSYPGLDITCTKVCEMNRIPKNKRVTWSQCLLWALEQVETEVILYLQEDYFFKDYVKTEVIQDLFGIFPIDPSVMCIHLTDQASRAEKKSEYENLDYVKVFQKDRVSCQAAFWRKEELRSIIKFYESGWEFEEFGSMRSSLKGARYLVVNERYVKKNSFEIIPYVFTGIVQGKWLPEVEYLFRKHDVKIDFQKRGFVDKESRRTFRVKLLNKMKRLPILLKNALLIWKVKLADRTNFQSF